MALQIQTFVAGASLTNLPAIYVTSRVESLGRVCRIDLAKRVIKRRKQNNFLSCLSESDFSGSENKWATVMESIFTDPNLPGCKQHLRDQGPKKIYAGIHAPVYVNALRLLRSSLPCSDIVFCLKIIPDYHNQTIIDYLYIFT